MSLEKKLAIAGTALVAGLVFWLVTHRPGPLAPPAGTTMITDADENFAVVDGPAIAQDNLPFLSFEEVSAAAPAPAAPSAPTALPKAEPFSTAASVILMDGREAPATEPLGMARIGGNEMPVYYSGTKFYRAVKVSGTVSSAEWERAPSSHSTPEIRDMTTSIVSGTGSTDRGAALAKLKAEGYRPALLLPSGERVIPTGDLNVVPQASVSATDFHAAIKKLGFTIARRATATDPWWLIRTGLDEGKAVLEAATKLARAVPCRYSEPNWFREVKKRSIPSDPYFKNQWHLRNTGQTGGTARADIGVDSAWDITTGNSQVIVAVFDDGYDLGHTDLPAATTLVHPWDFVRGTNSPTPADVDPEDPDNHGTAVWGLIAAPHSNGRGVAGVAPGVKFMPLRNPIEMDERSTADAIRWAADKGAHIMSNSWGYADPSSVVTSALLYARTSGRGGKGTLVLFASGNENVDIGTTGDLSNNINVLAIGATTHQDRRTTYSNFGDRLFAVAPAGYGENVGLVTTDRRASDGYTPSSYTIETGMQFDGTSGACPIAAGVAALVFSVNPSLTRDQVADILKSTADKVQPGTAGYDANGHSRNYGYGRLNARKALDRARATTAAETTATPTSRRVLFKEDFESLADGAKSVANKWSLTTTGVTGAVLQVATVSGNKYLKAAALQGTATWKTVSIDIAGLSDITLRAKFAEIGTLEADDAIEGWYQIDGKTPVRWFRHADDATSTFAEKTVAGLSGSQLVVWCTFANGASEEWRLDEIEVSGGGAAAPTGNTTSGNYLFREDFEAFADGTNSAAGKWTLASTGAAGSILQVATVSGNKHLKAANLQGVASWRSASIDLSGRRDIAIRCRVAEIGTLEATDTIAGYYQIDGGAPVRWFALADDIGSTFLDQRVAGLNGSRLVVWIECSNGSTEEWRLDEIEVTSSPATTTASTRSTGRTVYQENFEKRAAGSNFADGEWTSRRPAGEPGALEVGKVHRKRFFSGTALSGGGTWNLTPVRIAGYKSVTLSLLLSEIGEMEDDDTIRATYRVNGGAAIPWFDLKGDLAAGADGVVQSVSGISGETVEVTIEFRSNAQSESWRIDNFAITGE